MSQSVPESRKGAHAHPVITATPIGWAWGCVLLPEPGRGAGGWALAGGGEPGLPLHRQRPSLAGPQPTWPPCCPTSRAGSSSTPSSTWVLSGCSRCCSQTRAFSRASCSSASSQVRGRGLAEGPGALLRGVGTAARCGAASSLLGGWGSELASVTGPMVTVLLGNRRGCAEEQQACKGPGAGGRRWRGPLGPAL